MLNILKVNLKCLEYQRKDVEQIGIAWMLAPGNVDLGGRYAALSFFVWLTSSHFVK